MLSSYSKAKRIFNNPVSQAKNCRFVFFKSASLSEDSLSKISSYSDLIIQTKTENVDIVRYGGVDIVYDPIPFYEFTGNEYVFDCTYNPHPNPLIVRAKKSGCNTANSFDMIQRQSRAHFELLQEFLMTNKNLTQNEQKH